MSGPRVDNEKLAIILVEALFFGDKRTASKHDITPRTIINYRNRLKKDKELSRLFLNKKDMFVQNWADKIPVAIQAGIEFLTKAFIDLEPTPENVHAVAGAMKLLADIGLTKEMFDVRFGKIITSEREGMGQVESRLSTGRDGV